MQGLRKEFGTKRVVDDMYMDVEHNEIFGLLGPNGAGKTTAMNVMTADFVPTSGEVSDFLRNFLNSNLYFCIFLFNQKF